MHQSDAYLCLEMIPEASKTLNETINLLETQKEEYLLSIAYNNMSIINICENRIDDAIDYLEKSREYNFNNLEVIFNLTLLLIQRGRNVEACILWMKFRSIKIDEHVEYYSNLYQNISSEEFQMDSEPILSHVSGKVSQQQQMWLDLEILMMKIDLKDTNIFLITERMIFNQK
jgi:tetratricopeptide (TPR) repeat protein